MTAHLYYDPQIDDHPANKLDDHEFKMAAHFAAQQLDEIGFTYVSLSPGDGTNYRISIVRPPMISQWERWEKVKHITDRTHPAFMERPQFNNEHRYWVAHSIGGQLYGWNGQATDWSYVYEKWTRRNSDSDRWTARVIGRFLTTLSDVIAEREKRANGVEP